MQAKARTLPADAIVLDLEDGVAPPHKADARETGLFKEDLVAAGRAGGTPIARASPRLVGLAFGADDLAAAMGLGRTAAPADLSHARARLPLAAHAAGLEAIDMVHTGVPDVDAFRREAEAARALGYTGKRVIHRRQIDPANEIFAPSAAEVAWARQVVAAYEAAPRGAIMVEGRMVDAPVVRQALRLLARAVRAGRPV